jgi:hypothetical protein
MPENTVTAPLAPMEPENAADASPTFGRCRPTTAPCARVQACDEPAVVEGIVV